MKIVMKHVLLGALEKTIEFFPDVEVLNLLKTASISEEEVPYYYEICRKAGHKECSQFLHERKELREKFYFLGDFYPECLESRRFELLAYPRFETKKLSFKEVIQKNFVHSNWTIKPLGQKTKKFGVTFLNNLFELYQMNDLAETMFWMEKFYNLDHTKELPDRISYAARRFHLLMDRYTEKRFFDLLFTIDMTDTGDIRLMLKRLAELSPDEQKAALPRKPKSMKEIHDALSIKILEIKEQCRPLEQEIDFLDGKIIKDFVIEVPKTSYDLRDTSKDLKHCVHTYTGFIKQRECQILNLKKDGLRIFTIELKKRNGKYRVTQFKGAGNENSMEGPDGVEYVQALESLCEKGLEIKALPLTT